MSRSRVAWAFFGVWLLAAGLNLAVGSWRQALPYVVLTTGAGAAALLQGRGPSGAAVTGDEPHLPATTTGVAFAVVCVVVALLARASTVFAVLAAGCAVLLGAAWAGRRR